MGVHRRGQRFGRRHLYAPVDGQQDVVTVARRPERARIAAEPAHQAALVTAQEVVVVLLHTVVRDAVVVDEAGQMRRRGAHRVRAAREPFEVEPVEAERIEPVRHAGVDLGRQRHPQRIAVGQGREQRVRLPTERGTHLLDESRDVIHLVGGGVDAVDVVLRGHDVPVAVPQRSSLGMERSRGQATDRRAGRDHAQIRQPQAEHGANCRQGDDDGDETRVAWLLGAR